MYQEIGIFVFVEIASAHISTSGRILLTSAALVFIISSILRLLRAPLVTASVALPASATTQFQRQLQLEKHIQSEILSVSKTIHSAESLVQSLLDLFARNAASVNLIHVATILHRFASEGIPAELATRHACWPAFVDRALELLPAGTPQIKTGIAVISQLSKLTSDPRIGDAANAFMSLNDVQEAPMIIQLLLASPRSETLLDAYMQRISSTTPQLDLILLITKNVPFNIEIVYKYSRFTLKGISHIINAIVKRATSSAQRGAILKHISKHIDWTEKGRSVNAADVMAAATICKSSFKTHLMDLAISKYFDLAIPFIKEHVLSTCPLETPLAEHLISAVLSEMDSESPDAARLALALRILVSSSVKLSEDLLSGFNRLVSRSDPSKDLLDLVSLLAHCESSFASYLSTIAWPRSTFADVARLVDALFMLSDGSFPDIELGSRTDVDQISASTVMSLIAGFGPNSPTGKRLAEVFADSIEKFDLRGVVDSLNYLAITDWAKGKRRGTAMRLIQSCNICVAGSVVPALRALRRVSAPAERSAIQAFIGMQVPMISSQILTMVVQEVPVGQDILQEVTKRIKEEKFSFIEIVTVLRKFYSSSSQDLDGLFQALQVWLVPQIPKLTLVQISEITCVLEAFENREKCTSNILDQSSGIMTP